MNRDANKVFNLLWKTSLGPGDCNWLFNITEYTAVRYSTWLSTPVFFFSFSASKSLVQQQILRRVADGGKTFKYGNYFKYQRFIYTERTRKRILFLCSLSLLNVNNQFDSLWTHLEEMSLSHSLLRQCKQHQHWAKVETTQTLITFQEIHCAVHIKWRLWSKKIFVFAFTQCKLKYD